MKSIHAYDLAALIHYDKESVNFKIVWGCFKGVGSTPPFCIKKILNKSICPICMKFLPLNREF